jgi:hypothetical protein
VAQISVTEGLALLVAVVLCGLAGGIVAGEILDFGTPLTLLACALGAVLGLIGGLRQLR